MGEFITNRQNISIGDIGNGTPNDSRIEALLKQANAMKEQGEAPEDAPFAMPNFSYMVNGIPEETLFSVDKLVKIPAEWNNGRFPDVTEEAIIKMAASVVSYGLLHRITIWVQPDGTAMILGGNTRTEAYRMLYELTHNDKYLSIPCLLFQHNQINEDDAHRIFLVSNLDQRRLSTKSIGLAYLDLLELEKKRPIYLNDKGVWESAAKQYDVSKSTFGEYIRLATELDDDLLRALDRHELLQRPAYHLTFLPRDLQHYIFEQGYYRDLNTRTADKLKKNAKSPRDIDEIMRDADKQAAHTYSVTLNRSVPRGCEIVSLFVPKKRKRDLLDRLCDMIQNSDISNEDKKALLATIES